MRVVLVAAVIAACSSGEDGTPPASDATVLGDGGVRDDGSIDGGEGLDGAVAEDAAGTDGGPAGPRYDEVVFLSTHNSYSGGARGSLVRQLDVGVRFLELDVHDNDYGTRGYTVGHDAPGHEVELGGDNPPGIGLDAWLGVIASWSDARPGHAPITIGLDLKDDLTDNRSFAEGNLSAMNDLLRRTFGERLLRADEIGTEWPSVDTLRGRVIAVLSGDVGSRLAYVRDPGNAPAVALNARGDVIEVHDSGSGTLWYWTGELLADGSVLWHRHGRYDDGRTPAVAMNDDGWIVEVHQSESATTLWYRVGRLGADYEVDWGPSRMYDDGVTPTIRFAPGSSTTLREIHRSESTTHRWFWDATLDTAGRALVLGAHDRTSEPLHLSDEDGTGTGRVRVLTGADGATPAGTLLYATDAAGTRRIRYEPLAFVEMQQGNDTDLARRFYAAPSGSHGTARAWRAAGGVVRLWGFDEGDTSLDPPVQLPATDTPEASWYLEWADRVGAYER